MQGVTFTLDQHHKVCRITEVIAGTPKTYTFTSQWYDADSADWVEVVGGVANPDGPAAYVVGGSTLAVDDLVLFRIAASPTEGQVYELTPLGEAVPAGCCPDPDRPVTRPLPCPVPMSGGGDEPIDCDAIVCVCLHGNGHVSGLQACVIGPPWELIAIFAGDTADSAYWWLLRQLNGETPAAIRLRCGDQWSKVKFTQGCDDDDPFDTGDGTGVSLTTCVTLSDGTGAAAGLSAPVTFEVAATASGTYGFVWPIDYTSDDGTVIVKGYLAYCPDSEGLRFIGTVTASGSDDGDADESTCGCTAGFPACPAAGDPDSPAQTALTAFDQDAGTQEIRLDLGCGTLDVAIGPCPASYDCVLDVCTERAFGAGAYDTYAECVAAPCGEACPQCPDGIPAGGYTFTAAGFDGCGSAINGAWTLSDHNTPCSWRGTKDGFFAQLSLSSGAVSLVIQDALIGSGVPSVQIDYFDPSPAADCCVTLTLPRNSTGTCDWPNATPTFNSPASIDLVPSGACA